MLNAHDFSAAQNARPVLDGDSSEAGHGAIRVNKAVGWAEARAQNVVAAELRVILPQLVGGDHLHILKAQSLLLLLVRRQVLKMRRISRQRQISLRTIAARMSEPVFEAGIK